MATKKATTAPKKVSKKNYENATYKTELEIMEYNALVTSAVTGIANLYDQGLYGFNNYVIQTALVESCTNINIANDDMDVKCKFYTETDVIDRVCKALGETTVKNILNDIDLGIRYRISTNPDIKGLISGLGSLVHNITKNTEHISDETLAELMTLAKNVAGAKEDNADK